MMLALTHAWDWTLWWEIVTAVMASLAFYAVATFLLAKAVKR